MIITVLAVQQQQTLVQEAATLEDCPTTTETDTSRTPEERASRQATRAARQGQDGRTVTSVVINNPQVTTIIIHETVAPTIIVGGSIGKNKPQKIKGQLIVKYKKDKPRNTVDEKVKRRNGKIKKHIDRLRMDVVQVPTAQDTAAISELRQDPNVEYVYNDVIVSGGMIPNDANFAEQYALQNTGQGGGKNDADIDAPEAWDKTKGNSSVKVAILDTGIDKNHPDLKGKVVAEKNFLDGGNLQDDNGHGTHTAGIAAAIGNNGIGISGVCPECSLLNGKVLDSNMHGPISGIIDGIAWATQSGANVINMSLGVAADPAELKPLEDAVNDATNQGVVVVAIAGNCGDNNYQANHCSQQNQVMYPGGYGSVISVAATDNKDGKASFSSFGSTVDVAAPGFEILSSSPGGAYQKHSGTSQASPHVAGLAGLLFSQGKSASQVRSIIQNSADKINGTGNFWQYGRINAASAVGSTTSEPNPTDMSGTAKPTKNPCKPTRSGTKTPNGPTRTPGSGGNPRLDPRRLGCSIFPKMPFCRDIQNGNTGGRPCNTGNNPPRSGSGRNGQENTSNKTGNVNIGKINNDGTSNTKITINGKEVTAEGSTFQNGEDINTGGQQGGSHRTEINIDRSGQNQIIDRSGSDGNVRTNTQPGNNTGGCDNTSNPRNNTGRNNTGGNNVGNNTRDNRSGNGGGGGLLCRFAPWLRMCNRSTQTTRSSTMNRNGVRGAATINSFLLEENVIYACMAREKSCTPEQKAAADRNKDGKVNRTDYNILMNELQQISP